MSDDTDDLLSRLQALSPAERDKLLAALGSPPPVPPAAPMIETPTSGRDVNIATSQTIIWCNRHP